MTLVSGIVCRHKGEKCVLLTGDKAISYGIRVLESPKIKQVNDFKIVVGDAGDSSDLQRFYLDFEDNLENFFTDDKEQYKNRIVNVMDVLLVQGMFLRKFRNARIEGDILIGATDTKTTKLYHIYAGGTKALEIGDFACIGIGAEIVGTLMLKSLYNPKSPLTLDEAVRCAAVVNILASRLTRNVSANFDCFALCNDKVGRLAERSKGQVVKDANSIANKWLDLMRRIFFLPVESKLGFVEESNTEKLVKEFIKVQKKEAKRTVLIIDDMYPAQKDISNSLERILKQERLECKVLTSRAEFKKEYKKLKDKLRLVILDRRIEHRVTTDILKAINRLKPTVPVLLLSRGLKEQDIESFLQKGISFHISKEEIEKEPQKAQNLISGILKEGDYLWEWK